MGSFMSNPGLQPDFEAPHGGWWALAVLATAALSLVISGACSLVIGANGLSALAVLLVGLVWDFRWSRIRRSSRRW
jgi:hypothetical protein